MGNSDRLYVITCVFNPTNAGIRTKLYFDFQAYMRQFYNVTLITVELAFGDAPFMVTEMGCPWHIQRRTNDVLWYKENLTNIGFKALPADARYVAWIDADVQFSNPQWVDYTVNALGMYKFIQMFDTCDSLGPQGDILRSDPSFIYNWANEFNRPDTRGQPGGAWAARVETLRAIGYLIDWDIVGASDRHAVFGLTDQTQALTNPCTMKNQQWIDQVKRHVNGSVSYIDGTLIHFFHGYPSDRGYGTRGQILIDHQFDPDRDVGYREDGLLYLATQKPALRQNLIDYFISRNEHGPDAEILYMVTCVFNPSNYQSRYNRYFQFAEYITQFPNVHLTTIELSINGQDFQVTQAGNANHIQMYTDSVLWYKENLLNIAIESLPDKAQKVAWVDCDVAWDNPHWVSDTLESLNHHPVVQMFETWQNLDEYGQELFAIPEKSFVKRWTEGSQKVNSVGSTGMAWAARRSVLRQLGGLIDWGIVGSGDYYMAFALTGRNHSDVEDHITAWPELRSIIHTYEVALEQWIVIAEHCVKRNIGYVKGNIRHFFHGKRQDRGYHWRWMILARHHYDPALDIGRYSNGLIYIKTDKPGLQRDIVNYFNQRQEDVGITVDHDLITL